jgi:oligopeptide/dipeptide ABC transporter ATP-binding protein
LLASPQTRRTRRPCSSPRSAAPDPAADQRQIRMGQNVPMTISADDSGPVRIVTAVLRDGDRVLLCHRSAGRRWYPDVWDLPGGHVEEGQDPTGALNPRQSVYESVAEGLRIHTVVERARRAGDKQVSEVDLVARALSQAGLRPPELFFLSYPHELSGGQRQRVVIAGALALEPDVLVADEPVSSLDASIRGEILALLLRLRDDLGLSVLVVTHDLGLAWNIADRIAVMYLGRIVEVGTTEQVLSSPRHPYTRALLSVVPEIEQIEPIVLRGETPDPTRVPAGCRFHPRCPALLSGEAERHGIQDSCVSEDLPVLPATGDHRSACWLPESGSGKPLP